MLQVGHHSPPKLRARPIFYEMKYRKVLRLLVMIPPRINEIVAISVVNDAPFSNIAYCIYLYTI